MLYIASGLQNRTRVQELRDKFIVYNIHLSYDWTTHGQVSDLDRLQDIARNEVNGVLSAKCILAVMPGGRGTHYEMGVAWAMKKPIILLIEDPDNHQWTSFHRLPEITITYNENEAIAKVIAICKL